MNVEIRTLEPGDEAVLGLVAGEVFDHPVSLQLTREFLRDPRHHIVVAVDAGTVVGFASGVDYIHPDKSAQLWINEIGVAPAYRRFGIGRKLMQALFDVGRSLGCHEAWVGTECSNAAAVRLYASLPESAPPQNFVLFEFAL